MLEPTILKLLRSGKNFWEDYFWSPENTRASYPELDAHKIEFAISPQSTIVLSADSKLWEHTLFLKNRHGGQLSQLGWSDQAHFHPDIFRLEELIAICKCLARLAPEWKHPGIPLLLLWEFCPITSETERDSISKLVADAFCSLISLTRDEAMALAARIVTPVRKVMWVRFPFGHWILEGESPHSLRHPRYHEFPLESFEEMLAWAQREADRTT